MSNPDSNRKLQSVERRTSNTSSSSGAQGNQAVSPNLLAWSDSTSHSHYIQATPIVPYGFYPLPLDLSGQMFQQPLPQGWIQYHPYTVSPGIPAVIIPQGAVMYRGGTVTESNQQQYQPTFHQQPHHRSLPNLRYPDTTQLAPVNGLAPILSRSDEDEEGMGRKSNDQPVSTTADDSTDFKQVVNHAIETKRNVYVRGLPPFMNDTLLMELCTP